MKEESVDPPDAEAETGDEATSAVVMSAGDTTVIARTVARVGVPIIALTAVSMLIRGHNLPGGGFIGGVLTAAAFTLLFIVYGIDYVRDTGIPVLGGDATDDDDGLVQVYRTMFGVGLALAAGSGIVPILLGYEFLTQAVLFLEHLPIYEELEVASALAFDVGVYLVVIGGLLTILGRVGQE